MKRLFYLLPSFLMLNHATMADPVVLAPVQVEAKPVEEAKTAHTTLLTHNDLQQQGSGSFAQDALKTQAGVTVVQYAGPGSVTSSSIRGLQANHTLVTLFGVPLNASSLSSQHDLFAYFPIPFIGSMEIVRGAQGVAWGPHGMGGVIKINPIASDQPGLTALAEGGSFGTFKTAGSYGTQSEKTQLFGGVHHFQTDGLGQIKGEPKYGERNLYRQENILLSGAHEISEIFQIAGFAHGMRSVNVFDNSTLAPGMQKGKGTSDDLLVGATASHDGLSGKIKQSVTVSHHGMFSKQRESGRFTQTQAHTIYGRYENKIEWTEGQTTTQATTVGGTLDQENLKVRGTKNRDVHNKAIFGFHEAVIKFLTLTGGVRLHDHGQFGTKTLYNLGASVTQSLQDMSITFFSNFGTGFRPPTLSDLFSESAFSAPNPNLQPETNKMIDAGVRLKGEVPCPIQLVMTVFDNHSKKLISSQYITGKFVPMNIGKARSRGSEFTASVSPTSMLTLEGSYTFIHAKDKTPNAPNNGTILRQPKHQLSGTAEVTPREHLSFFTSVIHASNRKDRDFSTFPAQLVKLKPYTIVSAGASYWVTPSAKIYIRLENILNKTNMHVYRYATPPRSIYGGLKWTQNP